VLEMADIKANEDQTYESIDHYLTINEYRVEMFVLKRKLEPKTNRIKSVTYM